jgi:LysM repeat protein/nitrate reductase NapE component
MSEEAREEQFVDEVEETPTAETAVTNEPVAPDEAPAAPSETRGELIKFAILALVLLGAVLVVALARPLIFGHIVPAIMGEQEAVPQPLPVEEMPADADVVEPDEAYPLDAEDPEATEAYPAPGHDGFIPAVGGPNEAEAYPAPAEAEPVEAEAYPAPADDAVGVEGEETAVITHTVQANENLIRIAEIYGVSVETIIEFNNISNPNRIDAGTVLQIPVDGDGK